MRNNLILLFGYLIEKLRILEGLLAFSKWLMRNEPEDWRKQEAKAHIMRIERDMKETP